MYGAERTRRAVRISIRLAVSAILIVFLAVIITSVIASEDSDADIVKDDYYYRVISEEEYFVELSAITKEKNGTVDIPERVEDRGRYYTVIGIGEEACMDRKNILSVKIPPSVTYIKDRAFYGCSKLSKVTDMSNVSSIGESAFEKCLELSKIYIYADLKVIEPSTFCGCSALFDVVLPSTVKRIEEHAFDSCLTLTSFTLPKNLEYIGDYAFSNCQVLDEMTIPDSVTYLGVGTFSGCSKLYSVTLSESIVDIQGSLFMNCGNLTKLQMSRDVTWIGANAFYECINLSTITITEKVEFIGSFAFFGIDFYNFQETQKITDDSDLPGYTYVLKQPGIMVRQEIYAVHYNPNGGPNLADDEPHMAGQYFLPTRIESGTLICEDWIYDGKTYHYGEKILMPGEDITLYCVWTHADDQKKEDTGTKQLTIGGAGIVLVLLGSAGIACLLVAAFVLVKRH